MTKRSFWLITLFTFLFFVISFVGINESIANRQAEAAGRYSNDVQLLARCVNGEARGEPYEGQVAVAAVILNRVKHPSFPNTIAGVIYQPGAFTATVDGQIHTPISTDSTVYKACQDAMNGWDPSNGAVYYYNPRKTTNRWIFSRRVVKVIGNHRFAK
ncbi:MAG: cell wall hydrolase [Clostridia bacterium]|nr:cell wall hydrolase [Clostridia bacterium]